MRISEYSRRLIMSCTQELDKVFEGFDRNALCVEERVLEAFANNRVSTRHFAPSYGYGYDDIGRDTLDQVFANVFEAEDALVRPQLANGTHTLFTALAGLTEPNEVIVSATGAPYDTMETAIGLSGSQYSSLIRLGIGFEAVEMDGDKLNIPKVLERLIRSNARLLYVQRSRGYSSRDALSVEVIDELIQAAKRAKEDVIVFVDNCYGEFVEAHEPCYVGADIVCGSLIKNPGGGLAPTGGYIAGKADLIDRIAQRMTVPGTGREVGSYAAGYLPFYQGLFMAPHTVAQCLKGAALFAAALEKLGYSTTPASTAARHDIVQSITFGNKDALIAFCKAVQAASPIDSFVTPEPWDMPGYTDPVIMAAGTMIQGATTELSCDGPIREPYTAFLQGSLSLEHAQLAAMLTVDALRKV